MAKALQFGTIRDGKVYRKAFREYPELEIGFVRDSDEASLEYFTRRFDQIQAKVQQLLADMEQAENKGSYLNKIIHERESLRQATALGDFGPLIDLLSEKESWLKEAISQNRSRNFEAKSTMLEEMESLKESTDYKARAERIRDLRANWIKTGPVSPEHSPDIERRYSEVMNYFYEARREYLEQRNIEIAERLTRLDSILERQKELTAPDTHPGHIIKTLQQLSNEWREAGNVPKEEYEPRKEEFKNLKGELIRNAKRNLRNRGGKPGEGYKPRPLTPEEIEQIKHFKQKQVLLDEAKAILEKGDFRGAYQKVKEMQATWHNIGPIAKNKAYINKDFTYVCDRISEFSYLNKMLYQSNPYYYRLAPKDLANSKLAILKDIIRKEENDVATFERELNMMVPPGQEPQTQEARALKGRVNSQLRRLGVKKEILNEIKTELMQY